MVVVAIAPEVPHPEPVNVRLLVLAVALVSVNAVTFTKELAA
jgi:hypothetical protein